MVLGFHVVSPDYFFGNPIHVANEKEGFDRAAWMDEVRAKSNAAFPAWKDAIKAKYGEPLLSPTYAARV